MGLSHSVEIGVSDLTRGPAVIVECGFMTNKAELRKILTEDHRRRVAFGICEGVKEFFVKGYKPKNFERNEVSREELEKYIKERSIKPPRDNGNGNGADNGARQEIPIDFEEEATPDFEED